MIPRREKEQDPVEQAMPLRQAGHKQGGFLCAAHKRSIAGRSTDVVNKCEGSTPEPKHVLCSMARWWLPLFPTDRNCRTSHRSTNQHIRHKLRPLHWRTSQKLTDEWTPCGLPLQKQRGDPDTCTKPPMLLGGADAKMAVCHLLLFTFLFPRPAHHIVTI